MPCYDMLCDKCGHEEEVFVEFKDFDEFFPAKCPKCKSKKYNQNYTKKNIICRDGTPKTVGQQAERNEKEMGKEFYQKTIDSMIDPKTKAKKKAPTPFWRKEGSKPLNLNKVKNIKKYILEGDKN